MIKYLFVIFLIILSSLVQAEEDNSDLPSYHKGKLLLDLGFGSFNSKISSRSNPNTLTELYFLYDVRPFLLSSNQQRVNLGIFKYGSYDKPYLENYNARFAVEYALLDWFGIGLSGNGTNLTIKNITPGDYLTYPQYFFLPDSPSANPPSYSDYINLFKQNYQINFGTIDAEASFHYPLGFFDPYLRLGYGVAPGYTGVYKFSRVIGFRLFWGNSYLQTEYLQSFLYGIGSHIEQTDYLLENGFRFGFGYSFF